MERAKHYEQNFFIKYRMAILSATNPQTLPPWVADARGVSLVSALCAPAHSSRVEMYPQGKPPVTVPLAKLYCSSVTRYVYLRFQQRLLFERSKAH
ncbi:hypothetical protein RRG08_049148 [Elysia crispata]|uniref:Uncharacterized protein n=1 Tax=Elysia crispata TaxID=231223 RepID=A0AAE0YM17_9GAST|nr:hypothetical protein RRG08_049148 [Elysia crispata]